MSAEDFNDVERLREAFASAADEGSPDAVDAGHIFDALHGSMSVHEREAVIEEMLINPAAAQAWRLARELSPETVAQTPSAAPRHDRRWATPFAWMSMAAAAVLAVGVSWMLLSRQSVEPVYRTVETRTITADMPGATLSRAEPVIRWRGIEGARYRVRVLTPELDVLEESAESDAREYRLSAETLRLVAPGNRILWQVEGRVPDESVIVSPTFTIQVP